MKRTWTVLGIALAAILIIGGGVYLRLRGGSPGTETEPPAAGGLPVSDNGSDAGNGTTTGGALVPVSNLSQSPIAEYFVETGGDVLMVHTDGQIVRSGSSSTIVSSAKVPGLLDAWFSADGKKLLVESGDTGNPRWSVYDVVAGSWRILPISARDVRWAPQDQRVAYFSRRTNSSTLTILDLAKAASQAESVMTLSAEDLDLTWISSTQILFGERTSAAVPSSLWIFDVPLKSARLLLSDVTGVVTAWGRNQGLLFRSRSTGSGGSLSLVDASLIPVRDFTFLTLPSKCAFYMTGVPPTEALMCATPRDPRAFSGAALPDDYQKKAVMPPDDLYAIGLSSGALVPVLRDPNLTVDAKKLRVGNGNLYFINRWDDLLYHTPLPKEALDTQ